MGGNALAPYGAKRVSKAEAETQLGILQKFLLSASGSNELPFRLEPIKAYREKADFGDLDILVSIKPGQVMELLSNTPLAGQPSIRNGSVVSVGMPLDGGGLLQVDLISAPEHEFDFSAGYFAWNDLGNLVGRIAHKMGIKLGHDGLWLPMRDGTNLFDEILLTRDFSEALDFLGFDSARWRAGFDNVEQIYDYVSKGSRFNPDIFNLDNRNHTARVRDKKRPVYTGFLAWMDERPELKRFDWNPDKSAYLPAIFEGFPQSKGDHSESVARLQKAADTKAKFNGEVVSAQTGLSGKDLGSFIAEFKKSRAEFMESILSKSDDEIGREIRSFHHRRKTLTDDADTSPGM